MTAEKKAALLAKIKTAIQQTEQKIIVLTEASKPISPENSIGRISRMDAINNKSVSESALRMAKRKRAKLQHALSKLDDPAFGNCSNCERPIQLKRLMFMPESTLCVRCAR